LKSYLRSITISADPSISDVLTLQPVLERHAGDCAALVTDRKNSRLSGTSDNLTASHFPAETAA
jgi:hypothetical protein